MSQTIEPPNLNLPTKLVDGIEVPILEKPYTRILEAIERGGILHMAWWHGTQFNRDDLSFNFCGTVHCIAGWTTHLCGLQGVTLEHKLAESAREKGVYANPGNAAELILQASSNLPIPEFDPSGYYVKDDDDDDDGDVIDDTDDTVNHSALEAIRFRAAQEATP